MPLNLYDIAYVFGIAATAPYWLIKSSARRKVTAALRNRMGRIEQRPGDDAAILIHAVSLGEINAARSLIDQLRQERPGLHFIVSTTTRTGTERARVLYEDAP